MLVAPSAREDRNEYNLLEYDVRQLNSKAARGSEKASLHTFTAEGGSPKKEAMVELGLAITVQSSEHF
jgi:hypothetical protein